MVSIGKLEEDLIKCSFLLGIATGAIIEAINELEKLRATNILESLKVVVMKLQEGVNEIFYLDQQEKEEEC